MASQLKGINLQSSLSMDTESFKRSQNVWCQRNVSLAAWFAVFDLRFEVNSRFCAGLLFTFSSIMKKQIVETIFIGSFYY